MSLASGFGKILTQPNTLGMILLIKGLARSNGAGVFTHIDLRPGIGCGDWLREQVFAVGDNPNLVVHQSLKGRLRT